MKKNAFILLITVILFTSCEVVEDIFGDASDGGLTTEQIADGLKEALNVGTDSATAFLGINDGYYKNELVKILLPDEALEVKENIESILSLAPSLSSYLSLDKHFENVVKSINRAAEEGAKEAAPIFKKAISEMSITDALNILNGTVPSSKKTTADFDSTAATQYFKLKTTTQLTSLYGDKIDIKLDQDLGLGFSANTAWNTLRTTYNNAVNTITGNIVTNIALSATNKTLNPIQTESIGEYCTEKALDGLFLKVGDEEKKIRKNPYEYVSDIIKKVFGSIFEE